MMPVGERTPRCRAGYVNDEHWRVYFITDGDAIKIGYSGSVDSRVCDLQGSTHRELGVMLTLPGGPDLEAEFHRKFAHLRIRGEWFRAEKELTDFVGELRYSKGAWPPAPPRKRTVTKQAEEAIALRGLIDREGEGWPDDLKAAATWLRCELERMPRKNWKESGGQAHLAECTEKFARLYAAWRSA